MHETWIAIAGFEGFYEVSDAGRVRSLDRTIIRSDGRSRRFKGLVLSPGSDADGYLLVCLYVGGKGTVMKVHRLVARAFLPPSDLPQVNHKDLDRANNRATNLEWVTAASNHAHASANGRLRASRNPKMAKKLTALIAEQIREARSRGDSCAAIASAFGIAAMTVWRIGAGKIW